MNLDTFKKTFFPQFTMAVDTQESDDEREAKKEQRSLRKNKDKQPELIMERISKLENILKERFKNNWVSVRKAFLDLDGDYDGYITVEDILRYFG